VIAPAVLLAALLLLWWAGTALTGVEAWRLPGPGAVARRGAELLAQPSTWRRMGVTAFEALIGSVAGAFVALPMSYAIYRFRLFQAAVEPFLGATQAIPAIALAPLLVLWVGYGLAPIVALCALMVFFPILVSSVLGLRHLDRDILAAAALDGASGWVMARFIELPLAAPSILAGLRNGFTLSVTGAVVGEMVMGGSGLGGVLGQQRQNLDTAGMFVTIGILCLLAMSAYGAIYRIEKGRRRAGELS
jgi:NitT/TauT family transport system permease protein